MSKSEEIEAKLDLLIEQGNWCVKALKYLLAEGQDLDIEMDVDEDAWLYEEPMAEARAHIETPADTSQFEHAAVRSAPKAKPCRHRQQVLVGGMLRCADVDQLGCRFVFFGTGVRGKDPTSPVPAAGQENQFNHGTRV